MLPGDDGLTILERLRRKHQTEMIPVIMTTAKGSEYDKVKGLDLGADDYLVKPFGMMEMISRIKAVLRRSRQVDSKAHIIIGNLEIDPTNYWVKRGTEKIHLTLKEFELLVLFFRNPNRVFTRQELLDKVWGEQFLGETRTVDVHIGTLRTKLGEDGYLIATVRELDTVWRKDMTKKIFRTTLSASLGIVLVTILMIMGFLYNYFNHIQREQLRTQTALASQGISFEGKDYFENLKTSNVRITWVDNKGQVLYDTQSDAKHMKNHANRQEIKEAIKSGYGESTRWSATLTEKSIYAAQRLNNGTIVRLSVAQQTIFYLLLGMISPLAIIILLAIILSVLIARYIAKKVSEPLNNIDLDHPLSNDSYEEITPLLRRLDSHQAKIQHQKLLLQKRQKNLIPLFLKLRKE